MSIHEFTVTNIFAKKTESSEVEESLPRRKTTSLQVEVLCESVLGKTTVT